MSETFVSSGTVGRFGYVIAPKTVEGLLESALGQIEAMKRPDYRVSDGVIPTAEAFADLSARLIQCERMLAELPFAIKAAIRDELAER